jgi:hypothetical protein
MLCLSLTPAVDRRQARPLRGIRVIDTKLILVEGCPGSGKSSTSQHIARQLQAAGVECRWYYEEESPHPLAIGRQLYGRANFRDFGRDVLRAWRDFASRAKRGRVVHIVESHFFQDIIGPMVRVDIKPDRILRVVRRMAEFAEPLNPALVYLHQPDYGATMRRILDERGERIEQLYLHRAESSDYGKRLGLQGFDGLVQFWTDARAYMEQLVEELSFAKVAIDNTTRDWAAHYGQISELLDVAIGPPATLDEAQLREYAGTYTYETKGPPRRAGGETRLGVVDVRRRIGGVPRREVLRHRQQKEFTLAVEQGELVLRDYPWLWPVNRLIPLGKDRFDIRSWPFQMRFERGRGGAVVAARRTSDSTRWQLTGQQYERQEST